MQVRQFVLRLLVKPKQLKISLGRGKHKSIMKNLLKKIALLSLAMLVFGCSKDGVKGADGNANVQSVTAVVTPNQWVFNSSSNVWTYDYSTTLITSSTLSSGLVNCYLLDTQSGAYIAMPCNVSGLNFLFAFNTGIIRFSLGPSGSTNLSNARPSSNLSYRIVVVPSASGKMNINWKNYEEVKFKLNLID